MMTSLLLCDENRSFKAKRIAGFPYFHEPKERKFRSLLILVKYFAAIPQSVQSLRCGLTITAEVSGSLKWQNACKGRWVTMPLKQYLI